tara:strand:+ start:16535 stop:17383 length:849 start_codon:yes stop_codon:yes gene_type:complete
MQPEMMITIIFLGFVLFETTLTGILHKPNQKRGDATVEAVSTLSLLFVTKPLAFGGGMAIGALLMPQYKDILVSQPLWLVLGLFLVLDDLSQYWWHRLSHMVPWLYKLHRPHHNAEYMSIRMVYRNNLFYYLLMPGLWFSGLLVYLGGGWVYVVYVVVKMAVIFGAHSDVRWDKKLYTIPVISQLMWLVERVISTPATHSAHHGKHAEDGVTHYKGNYGNLLFFWDVLFGSAKITRRYPDEIGVENLPDTTVAEQLLWPLCRTGEQIVKIETKSEADATTSI